MSLTKHIKKIALVIAGVFLLVVGLALSLPGVPGPGALLVFWGLCLMGAEGIFLAAVAWFFGVIGLSWLGNRIIGWLRKASFRAEGRPAKRA
ncbi:MAG: hypothetical protein JW889_06715 [Verrucomicrobia bacterium]|nr:hypothetical protein [Verrucomicrobiota bacterium]